MPSLAVRRGLHAVHFHAAQTVTTRSADDHPSLPIIIPVVILGSLCLAFCLWVSYAEWSPWLNKMRRAPPVDPPAHAPETRERQ